MKFLYIGDAHESPDTPRCRTDNWEETRIQKTNEIRDLAKKHKVKAILQGGDFLSSPKYGLQFLVKVLNNWGYKVYNEVLLEEGAITNDSKEPPLVGPIGNHELFGMSHKNYEKTSLFFLERNGFITMPTKENPLVFKSDEGFTVAVSCGHYEEGMDETKEPYIVEEKKGDFHIHIVHGMLTKGKYFEDAPHTTIDEITHTKADLTIAGHDHVGFSAVEHEGKFFVNPGSPFRLTSAEIKRKPKVLLIDISKNGIKLKNIYLKSAKDGAEVINPDVEEFKKERKSILAQAREKVGSQNSTLGNINDIVKAMAKDTQTREEIRDKAILRVSDKIDNSRAKTIDNDNSLEEPYYISKLILENFGSHEYSKFDFSPRMNVFIGPTSSGKTTILRAFRWLYDDYGNSKRFVKKGAEEARVTIYTSHGYIITRFCNIKKATRNGFEITYPDGKTETLNTKGLKVVQDILSYSKLDLETKKIDLNFLSQGASWFFIGEDYSAGDRAKIIGSIYKTHLVDLAIKDLENESRKLAQRKEDKSKTLTMLNQQIEEFSFLNVMEQNIGELDKLKEKLVDKFNKKTRIKELNAEKLNLEENIKQCEFILNEISPESLEKNKDSLEKLKETFLKIHKIKPLADKLNSTKNQIDILEKSLSLMSNETMEQAKEHFNNLVSKYNLFIRIKELNDSFIKISNEINKYEEVLKHIDIEQLNTCKESLLKLQTEYQKMQNIKKLSNKLNNVLKDVKELQKIQQDLSDEKTEKLRLQLEQAKEKIEQLHKIKELISKQQAILKDVNINKSIINQSNEKLKKEVAIYKALLIKNEKCPICNSKITSVIADRIAESQIK